MPHVNEQGVPECPDALGRPSRMFIEPAWGARKDPSTPRNLLTWDPKQLVPARLTAFHVTLLFP